MAEISSGGEVTDALGGKLTFEQSKNRIVGRDADNLPRLLILADGVQFVMKVSQDGFSVLTASDDDLIFNSDNNLFKVVATGTISGTLPASTGFISIQSAHGLGYAPAIMAFIPVGGGINIPTPFLQFNSGTGTNIEQTRVEVDSTNVYLKMYAPNVAGGLYGTGFSRQAKYYLFVETAV
jgi:hypothetical protein